MILTKGVAPLHIHKLLYGRRTGIVEMTTSRGIYLLLSGKRILLCGDQYGIVPNGAAVENFSQLAAMLSPGQPVQTAQGALRFPAGKFKLDLKSQPIDIKIAVPSPKGLEAALCLLLDPQEKHTGLATLARPLFGGRSDNMNHYCAAALPHMRGLLAALASGDGPGIRGSVKQLLGLGPGLTPSADDVLSGLMYGLRHSAWRGSPACQLLTASICELAPDRTHPVSADYLHSLAMDAPFRAMALAWQEPARHSHSLLQIGSNSGSEMLLGLLLAGKLLGLIKEGCEALCSS